MMTMPIVELRDLRGNAVFLDSMVVTVSQQFEYTTNQLSYSSETKNSITCSWDISITHEIATELIRIEFLCENTTLWIKTIRLESEIRMLALVTRIRT